MEQDKLVIETKKNVNKEINRHNKHNKYNNQLNNKFTTKDNNEHNNEHINQKKELNLWDKIKNYVNENWTHIIWVLIVFTVLLTTDIFFRCDCVNLESGVHTISKKKNGVAVGGFLKEKFGSGAIGKKFGSLKSGAMSKVSSLRNIDPRGAVGNAGRAMSRAALSIPSIIATVVSTIAICAFVLPVGLILLLIIMSYRFIRMRWAYIKAL